jgi:copper chaperone NosL
MSRLSQAMIWVAVALFLGAYIFPLWSIRLDAPQYPEGIGMDIWVSRITGEKRYDLNTINGLNHYIGMKEIHPDSIAELRFMKYVVAGLIALGILAGVTRRRRLLTAWVVICIVAALAGLSDFYRWAYDYGHDLNPDAPIKVPGMTYQPPMLGSKKFLNITATSYPGLGGAMLMVGVALGALALVMEARRTPRIRRLRAQGGAGARAAAAAASLLVACSTGPRPIEFGTDACDYCRMTISDERYGSEIVTRKGRVYTYDAVECMVSAVLSGAVEEESVGQYLTVDYARPTELVDATTAVYLHSSELRSPMGMNLTSFAAREDAVTTAERYPGEFLTLDQARTLVDGARQSANGR